MLSKCDSKQEKKTIFFPIEHKNREFLPRILLASELAKRGFRVYIGNFQTIDLSVKKLRSSIFFHKSTYIEKSEFYKSIGSVFVFLDEEGGLAIPRSKLSDFCAKRYGVVSSEKNDIVFLPGREYKNIIDSYSNVEGVKTIVTGWPRIDLWRSEFRSLFRAEVDRITKKYGRFYLMITSFGMTSVETYGQRMASSTTEFQKSIRQHKYIAFQQYRDLIRVLSDRFSEDEQLLIRPHPSESVNDWKGITKDFKNVRVVRDGDISPWILSADAIISYGSTSNIQAAMNGIPSIQFRIQKQAGLTDTPVFELTRSVYTPDEVLEYLRFAKKNLDEDLKKRTLQILRDEMDYSDSQLASEKISDQLSLVDVAPSHPVNLSLEEVFSVWRSELRQFRYYLRQRLSRASTTKRTRIEKIPGGIKKREVESVLRLLSRSRNDSVPFKVAKVSLNLISIEVDGESTS